MRRFGLMVGKRVSRAFCDRLWEIFDGLGAGLGRLRRVLERVGEGLSRVI